MIYGEFWFYGKLCVTLSALKAFSMFNA